MALGFGEAGQRYAAQLPHDAPILCTGADGCAQALAESVQRRRAGEAVWIAPLVDEPRAVVAQRCGGRWLESSDSIDDRYRAFDALAAGRLDEAGLAVTDADRAPLDDAARRVLRDVAIMGDGLIARSERDAERIARILQRHRPTVEIVPGCVTLPHIPAGHERDSIVVWAPQQSAQTLGVIAMALEYLRFPVVYVCDGALTGVRGTFVGADAGGAALARAAGVIDASIGEPAIGIALAALGLPLAVASTSGAAEYLTETCVYDPWDWRTVFAAASVLRGALPPRVKSAAPLDTLADRLNAPRAALLTAGPLVSIVVLTYNRRALLPDALDSIAAQCYGNIEIVVVNNGGMSVADIVARYPNARLIDLPDNVLPNAAVEVGFAACTGAYFGVISDDDTFFPDHFARLVDALERSGEAIAHTNSVTRYLAVTGDERETVAYRVRGDRPSDRLQILVGGTMSFHSMLFRSDVRTTIGHLRVELAPADLEYTVRAAQHYDFVHVDAVTCEWNCPIDGSSYSFRQNMFEGLKTIYELYPSGPSEIVERRRERELERFGARSAGQIIWPPDLLLPSRAGAS